MQRESTKGNVREVVGVARRSKGHYKIVARMVNMGNEDSALLNFRANTACSCRSRNSADLEPA